MRYKPEQLPFAEFEETVRKLKRKLDKAQPHYPLIAIAVDRKGQELMCQRFDGPFEKPEASVLDVVNDWECPVTVTMQAEDKAGVMFSEELKKVTVQGEDASQLTFGDAGL